MLLDFLVFFLIECYGYSRFGTHIDIVYQHMVEHHTKLARKPTSLFPSFFKVTEHTIQLFQMIYGDTYLEYRSNQYLKTCLAYLQKTTSITPPLLTMHIVVTI